MDLFSKWMTFGFLNNNIWSLLSIYIVPGIVLSYRNIGGNFIPSFSLEIKYQDQMSYIILEHTKVYVFTSS